MPGIAGIVSNGSPLGDPNQLLATFERAHALPGIAFVKTSHASRHAAILNLATGLLGGAGQHYYCDAVSRTHLFVEGEVYDTQSLRKLVSVDDISGVPELLLELYRKFDTDFVLKINGEFNIVIYEEADNRLVILADHLSSHPFYYMLDSSGIYFGSEKKSLLATIPAEVQLDCVGLLQFFSHVHCVGDRTIIKGLKRLAPGGILTFENGILSKKEQPRFHFDDTFSARRADDLADEWAERLCRSTARRVVGDRRVVVSLSGGLDSRVVAMSMPSDKHPVWARTRGNESAQELQIAKLVAQRLGLEHMTESPSHRPLGESIFPVVWRTEGEASCLNGPTMLAHKAIKANGDFLAGGYLGNVSSGSAIDFTMLLPLTRHQFLERMYRRYGRYSPEMLGSVFASDFIRTYLPQVKAAFFDSYQEISGQRNIDLQQAWGLYNRATRMTMAAAPVDSHILQRVSPFYDRDNVEFFTRIPLHLRLGQTLYKRMIFRMGPTLVDIPNSNTMRRIRPGLASNYVDFSMDLGSRLGRRMRTFAGYREKHNDKRHIENVAALIRSDPSFRGAIEAFLDSPSCFEQIFNRAGIRRLLDQHYSGGADHSNLLGLVATTAATITLFVSRRPLSCPEYAYPL